MSSRTFIAREEKSKPDFKASEEKLALKLRAYAASDFNLKPMLFAKSIFPVFSLSIYVYGYD